MPGEFVVSSNNVSYANLNMNPIVAGALLCTYRRGNSPPEPCWQGSKASSREL